MEKYWWQNTNIYQLYPRSFQDSNGDGIGDLEGVISRLDYLKELGIEVIWLNPIQKSPMFDNGYDVSDYYTIDPLFGSNDTFDRLIYEANKRGMKIVMDMVVNHCSTQHEWFQKALQDPYGEYADYFYFRPGKDGKAPNNWRSVFGGSVWEPVPGTDLYYLHLFVKEQVDLNWENPKVREEIYKMMNYWLGKGIAGFRMDAVNFMKKDPDFSSHPADAEDGLCNMEKGSLYQPGVEDILRDIRDNTYKRDVLTIGEVGGVSGDDMKRYISLSDGYFSMIFDCSPLYVNYTTEDHIWCRIDENWDREKLKKAFFEVQKNTQPDCWIANVIENHDEGRSVDFFLPPEWRNYYGISMTAVWHMCRRGTPIIYQGQELGMANQPFPSIDDYDDCRSSAEYELALEDGFSEEEALHYVHLRSRDNARYPMSWDSSEKAGFTTGNPWLPISPQHETVNAEAEMKEEKSVFHVYQKLLALRKNPECGRTLCLGGFEPYREEQKHLIGYERFSNAVGEKGNLLVLCNYHNEELCVPLDGNIEKVLFDNYGDCKRERDRVFMKPYQALILMRGES